MDSSQGRDPELWEQGCVNDDVRNTLILPDLVRRIERLKPSFIGDVGSGTGYLPRVAAERISNTRCHWTLLEKDSNMRDFATAKIGSNAYFQVATFDILDSAPENASGYDLVFSLFATLDFGMSREIAANFVRLVRRGGSLLIYIPDMLEEIAQLCGKNSNVDALVAYRRGAVDVGKPDRFTKKFEPFVAHRIEICISQILAAGCYLKSLDFLERDKDRNIIALEFGRN